MRALNGRLLLVLAVAVPCLFLGPVRPAAAEGRPLDPWLWAWRGEGEHEHLDLLLGFRGEVSTHDSILIEFRLAARSEGRACFRFEEGEVPQLVLTPQGKKPRVQPLLPQPGLEQLLVNRRPFPEDNLLCLFRADLRAYFGKLDPGTYEIAVVFPARVYRLEGVPGFKKGELKAKGTFTVSATTLEEARQAVRPRDVMISRGKASFPDAVPTGTLTNKFDKPILVRVKPAPDGQLKSALKPPLRLNVVWQHWHPKQFWCFPVNELPAAGEHWPVYKLEPNKSVEVVLPEWDLEGDGIYRFGVAAHDATRPGAPFLTHVGTEPFVVDRVRPSAPRSDRK